uniref:Uncharacterized protein n=1 Tax=Anguilla anguilla TaxID=7936 RepID=A0A0E9SXA8_ANGAN
MEFVLKHVRLHYWLIK